MNRKDKEKLISAINDLSIEEKQTLKSITKAQRVLFGEMEFQRADNSLLVTLVINNLETGVQEAMTLIEIPNGEYETHSKREPYVTKGIEETLLGKKSSNAKPSNDQAKVEYLDDRQKFFGKYKITATCTNGGNSRGVVVTVTASSMPNEVLLSYSSSSSLIKATISGDIIIVNAAQTYTFSSTVYSFTGSGRMSGSAIVALNTIYIGQSSTLNCDETWMKQ